MYKYVMKRVCYALLTILLLIAITFVMMHAAPGNPFSSNKATSQAIMDAKFARYGLDKPLYQQFFIYIGNILQGDFGISIKYNRPITTIISESFPISFELGIRALIISIVGGIGLGAYAAIRRGKPADTVAMTIAIIGVSVPSFIVAALLQYFAALKLNQAVGTVVFPISGWHNEMAKALPSFALGLSSLATISRLMRTSMLDVMNSDYIKTAKAKGLSERRIVWKHAMRNAVMPVITVLGPLTASILTGAFVVEQVFSVPGMGKYFVMSITERDYTMIAGTTVFYGSFLIIMTLLVDLAYGVIDPRVKLTES